MAVTIGRGGLMTVGTPAQQAGLTRGISRTGGRSIGGSGGSGQTTQTQPTPSASELYGSAEQREAQIRLFRERGRAAFEAEVRRLKELAQKQEQAKLAAEIKRQQELSKQKQQEFLRRKLNQLRNVSKQLLQSPVLLQNRREQLRKEKEQLIKQQGTRAVFSRKFNRIDNRLQELTAAQTLIEAGIGFASIPGAVKDLIKNPENIKQVPANVKKALIEEAKTTGKLLLTSPNEGIAKIGTELFLLKGTGKAFKITGKLSTQVTTRLNPRFRKLTKTGITIPSKQSGKTLKIKLGGPVKKIQEPLKKQAKIAGKRVTAVSAQADRLVNLLRTKRVVRKPIPQEDKLTKRTKKLLKKFDSGKINKKQLINLDNRLRLETKGAGNILERSFFADPRGRFRPSRLGLQEAEEATLKDILKGDFTFKTQKPQILVFENVRVSKFPKELKTIEKKLKSGKSLTSIEARKLLLFQSQKSGKFKPIGALSKEPEITLAPGEVIKRVKKVGVSLINGKKVDIVQAKVIKPKKSTQALLKKANKGKLTTKELKKLEKKLKKETGFKTSLSRSKKIKRRLPIKRKLLTGLTSLPKRKKKIKKRIIGLQKRPTPRKTTITKRTGVTSSIPTKIIKRVTRPVKRISRVTPLTKKTSKKIIRTLRKKQPVIKRKRLIQKRQAYNVFARPLKKKGQKKQPKLIKVNKVPLSKKDAEDLRSYIADTSLSRTANYKKTSGNPQKPLLRFPKGYAKKTSSKFRMYKVIKGKRKKLKSGRIIEKGSRLLDTKGEKKGITLRKRIKQLTKKKKK